MLLNLPNLDGAARSGCTRLPLPFFFLLFLLLVAMRLDGEEHGRAQYGQLERNKDDGNPIHDFLKTLHGSLDDGSSRIGCRMGPMRILSPVAVTVPNQSPKAQTQIC